ncbi:MAG: hypothetical protein KA265_11535 [Piscinibacter sp.]|nr:hypothetical protein [Piscinibacter sp.]MBP6636073.1 hypothetical protein [Sulfuritalea sp.]
MTVDFDKNRRELIRWHILLTLYNASPVGAWEEMVLSVVQAVFPDATPIELRRQLDYLSDRELVALRKDPAGRWFADLTRTGTDVAEYTVECDPGIARPAKYW